MDKLTVIKSTAQIVKYCKDSVCESCLFYAGTQEISKCMWRNKEPCQIGIEDIITKWVDENE